MKKTRLQKLQLNKESLRVLDDADLAGVQGGRWSGQVNSCVIDCWEEPTKVCAHPLTD